MHHNPRDPESWCIKGTDESTLDNNLSRPLIQHDRSDLECLCIKRTSESTMEFNDSLWPVNTTRSTIHDLESGASKDPISPIWTRIHYAVHKP